MLDEAARYGERQVPGADRRLLHLGVEDGSETPVWSLTVAEDSVSDSLLRWWRLALSEPFSADESGPLDTGHES